MLASKYPDKPPVEFPRLETQRLVLREITLDDVPAIFRNFSDEEVTKWFFEHPYTRIDQAEEIIREFGEKYRTRGWITWGICFKGESTIIGSCGFEPFTPGKAGEIGFELAKAWWGRSLIREALQAIIGYGFERLDLCCIVADIYRTNARASALLERLGFQVAHLDHNRVVYVLKREKWSDN